jgi:hypothetical protein
MGLRGLGYFGRHIMRRWSVGALIAALLSIAYAFAIPPDDDTSSARQAVQQGNWPQAIADWQRLYVKGDPEAPAQLCALYFDARQGKFEVSRVTDWCRRAAGNNDALSLYRMGMLYLVGLGVDQDADQAQALCAAAGLREPRVPAGFCLAVASTERERAAQEQLRLPRARPPAAASAVNPDSMPEQNCDRAFTSTPFDTATASTWCGKAAADGDPEAQYRLGLMKLMGVGAPRDLDMAEADCVRAGASAKPHTATAFCIAAVAQLRQATASSVISRHTGAIDANPTTGRPLPKTDANPFAADRELDAPRKTPTGLSFTCREVTQWALFEAPRLSILKPRDTLFGRRIIEYRPADFAALDQIAVTCTKATAAVDPDGSLAKNFATFRKSLRTLEERQAELRNEQRISRDEAAQIKQVDHVYQMAHIAPPDTGTISIYSAQESACIDRVKRGWQASSQNNEHQALEISGSNRVTENGRYVAYGVANIVVTNSTQRDVSSVSMYRCTFDKGGSDIAKFELLPGFSSAD